MKLFTNAKLESLIVQFDFIGWSYTTSDSNMAVACSEKQALYLIKAISRARDIAAMPGNLWRMDHPAQARRDETYEVD